MQRRSLLQGAAALPLLTTLPAALWARAPRCAACVRAIRSGRAPRKWQELKRAVGGNLLEVHAALRRLRRRGRRACLRGGARRTSATPSTSAIRPGARRCPAGWMPGRRRRASTRCGPATRPTSPRRVNFARRHNLRLVVKGGGHSYLGTSNAADSLLIWTRAMNQVALHEAFVGEGCANQVEPQRPR